MANEWKGSAITDLLLEKMGDDLENDPLLLTKLMKALHTPADVIRDFFSFERNPLYRFSHKATWQTNDLLVMQAIFEEESRGKTLEEAIRLVGKHIPNYRVPSEILPGLFKTGARLVGRGQYAEEIGSKSGGQLSSLLTNPNLTMFGSYHYGVLRNFGEIGKELIDSSLTLAQRMTGDRRTYVQRYGPARLAENIWGLSKHQRDYVSVLTSIITPAPATLAALETAFNRDFHTGKAIIDPYHLERLPASIAEELAPGFAPLTFAKQVAKSPSKAIESLVGVRTPKYALAERRLLELQFEERYRVHRQIMEAISRGDSKTATDLMMAYNKELDQVLAELAQELGTTKSPKAIRELHLQLPTLRSVVDYQRSHQP